MANVFMPSVAASLNAGGQDNLEQIMKQRLFEQQMQQAQLQGQGQLNNFRLDLRQQDAQERYRQDVIAQNEAETQARLRIAQGKLDADAASAGVETQARQVVAALMREGKYQEAVAVAVESGITPPPRPQAAPRDPAKEAYDIAMARAQAEADARKKGLKPTKVAKGPRDNPEIPNGVKQALDAKRGDWPNAVTAIKDVTGKHWQTLRKDHPNLSLSKVMSYIENMYGQSVTPTEVKVGSKPKTLLSDEDMKGFQQKAIKAVDGFQSY